MSGGGDYLFFGPHARGFWPERLLSFFCISFWIIACPSPIPQTNMESKEDKNNTLFGVAC